jgi:hypothetical protein
VLLPEGMTAVRAARDDQLQTSINLALGSGVASERHAPSPGVRGELGDARRREPGLVRVEESRDGGGPALGQALRPRRHFLRLRRGLRRPPGLQHLELVARIGGEGERPYTEADPTGPVGVYGASKLAGDLALAVADESRASARADTGTARQDFAAYTAGRRTNFKFE